MMDSVGKMQEYRKTTLGLYYGGVLFVSMAVGVATAKPALMFGMIGAAFLVHAFIRSIRDE